MTAPGNLLELEDPNARGYVRSQETRDPLALDLEPNEPFYCLVWPEDPGGWQPQEIKAGEGVDPSEVGTWFLPTLHLVRITPGVGGHRTLVAGEKESQAYQAAVERAKRRGAIFLDPEVYPYRAQRPAQRVSPETGKPQGVAGFFHFYAFDKPVQKGRTTAQGYRWERNKQRMARWLLSLVRSGVVPAPSPELLASRKAELEKRVSRAQSHVNIADDQRKLLVAAQRTPLELELAAKNPGDAPEAPAPEPTRRKAA